MRKIHGLKPEKVIKAFERAGWTTRKRTGTSHVILTKEGSTNTLSIPIHKGKPVKKGLLINQIKKAGLTVEQFLGYYNF